MITLFSGMTTGPGDLDWFTTYLGSPADVAVIYYQIFDVRDTENPVLVHEEADASANHFATGQYYAVWSIPLDQDEVRYKIVWYWRYEVDSELQTGATYFMISNAVAGTAGSDFYVTHQDLYDEGVPKGVYGAEFLQKRIKFAQQYIEKTCRQSFLTRYKPMYLDGSGSTLLLVKEPIYQLEKLEISQGIAAGFQEFGLAYFDVYQGFENRDYPRIKISADFNNYLLSGISLMGGFPRGGRNIRLTGWFGYVEEDGRTPEPIKTACILLIKKYLAKLTSKAFAAKASEHMIKAETTDGHRYQLFEKAIATGRLTGDPIIDDILSEYMKGGYANTR